MSEVTLILHLYYANGNIRFKKLAPKLPRNVVWQEGMMYCVDDEFHCCVDSIMCDSKGNVKVLAEITFSGNIEDEDFNFLLLDGWVKHGNKITYPSRNN